MSEDYKKKIPVETCLHAASIVLGLGHPNIKAGLLISGVGCSTGLLVGIVDSQLVEGHLGKGSRAYRFTYNTGLKDDEIQKTKM